MPHYRVDLVDGRSVHLDADRLVRDLSHTAFHSHRDGTWQCLAVMATCDVVEVHQQLTRYDPDRGWVLAVPLKMAGAPLSGTNGHKGPTPSRLIGAAADPRARDLGPAVRPLPGRLRCCWRYLTGRAGPTPGTQW